MKMQLFIFLSFYFLTGDSFGVTNVFVDKKEPTFLEFDRGLAEEGEPSAQYRLGLYYASGDGVPNNDQEAVKWFRLAAEQGHSEAQYFLAFHYQFGKGVDKNSVEAIKWYQSSAKQGDVLAQYDLGICYSGGHGVVKDALQAAKWFRLAAEQGDAMAQSAHGVSYENGIGVIEDASEAVRWYRLSAEQGWAGGQYNLGRCYSLGRGVSKDAERAVYWYKLAAEQGHVNAQFNLGVMYGTGAGVVEDDREAVKWYRLAAEQGHASAQLNLGFQYYYGRGVIEDYVEAYAWYVLAGMNGSSLSTKNKEILCKKISSSQIAAGQQRAKELHALIERKKALPDSALDQPLSSEIAPSGFGSGFLVDGGYVLTCWHVVDGAKRVSILLNGKEQVASVIQKDAANDIAILKVSDGGKGGGLNLSAEVKLGEKVFTLGYPHPDLQGSNVKFTTGSISSLTGIDNSPRYFQISAPLQSGNSGGPLFDEHGNLVGIVAAKLDSLATLAMTGDLPQNVNYAIKVDYLLPLLKTVEGIDVGKEKTKDVNLLGLIEELKKSVVMIKVY